jgi:hypothetical protein
VKWWYRFVCLLFGHEWLADPCYVWTIKKLDCQRCGRTFYRVGR